MLWDIFCRVIDNHGDLGVCWRLAADLAARGERVRLWTDDATALRWMAPQGAEGVAVHAWPPADVSETPGEVVIEAFGCDLPAGFVRRMGGQSRPPMWINLEYLSAEGVAERNHRLPSPQAGGLLKWFFYPGFTPRTGGLLREPDLPARQRAFDAPAWLVRHGVQRADNEQVVSLFCYEQPALDALLDGWSRQPTQLLVTVGHAARQAAELLGPGLARGRLRATLLPALSQRGYDELLWAADINLVRGEDSFVRAQWAGKPFVWQIYAQHDGAHAAKLDAFLRLFLAGAEPAVSRQVEAAFHAWNGMAAPSSLHGLAPGVAWQRHAGAWRDKLRAQTDLTSQLLGFVDERG